MRSDELTGRRDYENRVEAAVADPEISVGSGRYRLRTGVCRQRIGRELTGRRNFTGGGGVAFLVDVPDVAVRSEGRVVQLQEAVARKRQRVLGDLSAGRDLADLRGLALREPQVLIRSDGDADRSAAEHLIGAEELSGFV